MSKANLKYKNHINHIFQDTEQSFNELQTPGWTSIVNTQESKQMKNSLQMRKTFKQQNLKSNGQQILNRLKSLPKIDEENNFYLNIRCNSSKSINKNVIIYAQNKTQQTQKNKLSNSKKYLNRFSSYKRQTESAKSIKVNTQKKRVSSFKSYDEQENLTNRIQKRILNNNQHSHNSLLKFTQQKYHEANYTKIHNFNSTNTNKNKQYINMYKQKLNQRNIKYASSIKVNEKQNKNILINDNMQNTMKDLMSSKRFKAITVHDHLYKVGQKLQSKKNMVRLIEQSYQKATVLTFNPKISQKSSALAQSKFLKKQNFHQQNEKYRHENCFNSAQHKSSFNVAKLQQKQNILKIRQQITVKQKQKMNQKLNNSIIVKLFNFLSEGNYFLSEQKMQANISKLSLSLIQSLDPIITKIYQIQRINQDQFLKFWNQNEQLKVKRNALLPLIEKSFKNVNNIDKKQFGTTNFNTNA